MLFNSLEYFLFLAITIVLCFCVFRSTLNLPYLGVLVAASLFFYSYWDPIYLPLILGSILFNFVVGRRLAITAREGQANNALLWVGIAGNLTLLAYFKYTDFLIVNLNAVTGWSLSLRHIVLPLGISFFTFTQIAFLVDAKQGKARDYSLTSYAMFVTFFPHLLAGPILHHAEMMPQFANPECRRVNWQNMYLGLFLFALGLFKKVVIADTFSVWANAGFSNAPALGFATAWAVTSSYTFQLYFDFSGYSDMAIGTARMFNIHLPVNFNSPYGAQNLQDFWRRWHMTLSRFLRDYIYIPLGGNRNGSWNVYRNLFLTFLLGGIWHGAGWTFVAWGCMHGAGVCIHKGWSLLKIRLSPWTAWAVTFLFVHVAWVFFRAGSFADARHILSAMISPGMATSGSFVMPPLNYSWFLVGPVAVFGVFEAFGFNSMKMLERVEPSVRWTLAIVLMLATATVLMLHTRVTEFLYFQF